MANVSRREFLRLSALTAAASVAVACGQPPAGETSEPVVAGQPTSAPEAPVAPAEPVAPSGDARFAEAPGLAEQVASGALAPVEERLPVEPRVIPVTEEIGQYGGAWHRCAVGPSDAGIINSRMSYEALVRWNEDGSGVLPNVAKSFEISDDATEFVFHLREGMKWSDGEPFTADDVLFYFVDDLSNTDRNPTFPKRYRDPANDENMTVEKLDDYSFKATFQSAYGLFIQMLAGPGALDWTVRPKHYLSQFHPEYADADELQAAIEAADFANWWELYADRADWQNPECPHIWAWLPTRVPPDVPVVCQRNPYYWKVDPEGNQLPYIDDLRFDIVENADLLNMKAVAGEIDCQFRHLMWTNYPLFVENAEQGEYRVMKWTLAEGSNALLHPNMNHGDPVMRELMQTKDFRIALSVAIDRPAINELAYQGFGQPRQAALVPQCPYYRPEHETKYAELDIDQGNTLLDGIGLTERDGEGFRLRPDGDPLTITIEYAPIFGPWRDVVNMVCEQWKEIGIRGIPKEEDRTLFAERATAGLEVDMAIWTMDRCFTPLIEPHYFMPISGGTPPSTAAEWVLWNNTRGEQGEEPPEDVKAQFALYDRCLGAMPEELPALAQEFFDNASEALWFIGTVGVLPHVGIVKENFRNVPEDAISDWLQLTPGNTNVEQYFWKQ